MDPEETAESRWQILLLFEFTLLAISFVSPITPSKTGSDRGLAHAFLESPSYLEEVAVSFLALHVLLLAIGVVSFVVFRLRRARDGKGRRAGRGRRQRPKRRR